MAGLQGQQECSLLHLWYRLFPKLCLLWRGRERISVSTHWLCVLSTEFHTAAGSGAMWILGPVSLQPSGRGEDKSATSDGTGRDTQPFFLPFPCLSTPAPEFWQSLGT